MNGKRILPLWLVIFCLWGGGSFAQEIFLDGVQKCGRLKCYPAMDDPQSFYYLPGQARLAERDGRPEFSFMKYARLRKAETAGTKTTEGGGLLHFLATYGVDEETLQEAEADLRERVPGAKIVGPVIFRRGTFALVTAFKEENKAWVRAVALGKAPLMEGQKTAVSLALTRQGAEVLWQDFQMATPDISLIFELEFAGYRKPYEAEVIVDWSKVFQNHRVQAGMRYAWFGADIDLLFQELRRTGAIKIIVKGEHAPSDKLLASVQNKLLEIMFEPIDAQNLMQQAIKEDSFSNLNQALEFLTKTKKIDQTSLRWPTRLADWWNWRALWNWCPSAEAGIFSGLDSYFFKVVKAIDRSTAQLLNQVATAQQAVNTVFDPQTYLPEYGNLCPNLTSVCGQVVTDSNLTRACGLLEPDCEKKVRRNVRKIKKDISGCLSRFARCSKSKEECHSRFQACIDRKKENWKKDIQRLKNWYLLRVRCVNTTSDYCQKKFARCMDSSSSQRRCLKRLLACSCGIGKKSKKSSKKEVQSGKPKTSSTNSQSSQKREKTSGGRGSDKAPSGATNQPQKQQATSETPKSTSSIQSKKHAKKEEQTKKKPTKDKKKPAKEAKKGKPTSNFSLVAAYRMRHIRESGYFYYSLKRYRMESQVTHITLNIGDLYQRYGHDNQVFREILIDDPVFKQRNILVTIDGQDSRDFGAYVNAVTVQLRKHHQSGEISTDEVIITPELFDQQGNAFFLRYGWKGDRNRQAWLRYEYRVVWELKGGFKLDQGWQESDTAVLNVVSPFRYLPVTIEGDKDRLDSYRVRHAVVTFLTHLGSRTIRTEVTLKNSGPATGAMVRVPVPREGAAPEVLITWHLEGGSEVSRGPFPLKGAILYWDELP